MKRYNLRTLCPMKSLHKHYFIAGRPSIGNGNWLITFNKNNFDSILLDKIKAPLLGLVRHYLQVEYWIPHIDLFFENQLINLLTSSIMGIYLDSFSAIEKTNKQVRRGHHAPLRKLFINTQIWRNHTLLWRHQL